MKWPDSTCLSSRWPSIMQPLSCREGRFSFFCWRWRSWCGDGGTQNVTVVFVRCGIGSALLGFVNFFPTVLTTFVWRPQSGSSGACHSAKTIYLHRTGLRMYISLYEKLCCEFTNMGTLVFWAFLFGYQATHIFVPENQLHVLWEKLKHPESLWKSEFSRPRFCAAVKQKREEIKPELNKASSFWINA